MGVGASSDYAVQYCLPGLMAVGFTAVPYEGGLSYFDVSLRLY